jgi:hypothetical protein
MKDEGILQEVLWTMTLIFVIVVVVSVDSMMMFLDVFCEIASY